MKTKKKKIERPSASSSISVINLSVPRVLHFEYTVTQHPHVLRPHALSPNIHSSWNLGQDQYLYGDHLALDKSNSNPAAMLILRGLNSPCTQKAPLFGHDSIYHSPLWSSFGVDRSILYRWPRYQWPPCQLPSCLIGWTGAISANVATLYCPLQTRTLYQTSVLMQTDESGRCNSGRAGF